MTIFLIVLALYFVAGFAQLRPLARRSLAALKSRPELYLDGTYVRKISEPRLVQLAGRRACLSALMWPVPAVQTYAIAPMVAEYTARQAAKEAERIATENRAAIKAHKTREQQAFDALLEAPKPDPEPAPMRLDARGAAYPARDSLNATREVWRAAREMYLSRGGYVPTPGNLPWFYTEKFDSPNHARMYAAPGDAVTPVENGKYRLIHAYYNPEDKAL